MWTEALETKMKAEGKDGHLIDELVKIAAHYAKKGLLFEGKNLSDVVISRDNRMESAHEHDALTIEQQTSLIRDQRRRLEEADRVIVAMAHRMLAHGAL